MQLQTRLPALLSLAISAALLQPTSRSLGFGIREQNAS
jgi:hypothetical protein